MAVILTQLNHITGFTPVIIYNLRIMLTCGINVFMTEDICHKVYIVTFLIEISSVCAAQLMRSDVFDGCYCHGIFLNQILYRTYTQALVITGYEQCILMPGSRIKC